jgi:hypothetical protein
VIDAMEYSGHLAHAADRARGLHHDPVLLLVRPGSEAGARLFDAVEGSSGAKKEMLIAEAVPDDTATPKAVLLIAPLRVANGLGFESILEEFRRRTSTEVLPGQVPVVTVDDGGCTVDGIFCSPKGKGRKKRK